MLYDVSLTITYRFDPPAEAGRQILCMMPVSLAGVQVVRAADLSITPAAAERQRRRDFFGNWREDIVFDTPQAQTQMRMRARVERLDPPRRADTGASLSDVAADLARWRSLQGQAPLHYTSASPRLPMVAPITDWARKVTAGLDSVQAMSRAVCDALHEDFTFDPNATFVDTSVEEAFDLRRGVCQDFSHIAIVALRGLGLPAGYVSGFLRTDPPEGQARLEGADAMHAWVRVWCGADAGWLELDPTNGIAAGLDHIVIGYGRDYLDVAPVRGVLRLSGGQYTSQAVDVVPVETAA